MIIITVLALENQVLPLGTGRVTFPLRICALTQRAAELLTFGSKVGEQKFRSFPRHSRPLKAWHPGGSSPLPGSGPNNLALPASVITAFATNLHSQVRTGPESTLLSMHQFPSTS